MRLSIRPNVVKLIFLYTWFWQVSYAEEKNEYQLLLKFSGKSLNKLSINYFSTLRLKMPVQDRVFIVPDSKLKDAVDTIFNQTVKQIETNKPFSLRVLALDEIRSLEYNNRTKYDLLLKTIYDSINSFDILKNNTKILLINSVDQGWAYYKTAVLHDKKVSNQTNLMVITTFSLVLAFNFEDNKNDGLLPYVSKFAKNEGKNNTFSMHFDCAGPEHMEILLNNYLIRASTTTSISNPCYPTGYKYNSYNNRMSSFESCDPSFYVGDKDSTSYYIRGSYNRTECVKVLDGLLSEKGGQCEHPNNCTVLDPKRNLFDKFSGKLQIYDNSLDETVELKKFLKSPEESDKIIEEHCSNYNSIDMNKRHETCFRLTYIFHLLQPLITKNRIDKVSKNSIRWNNFFVKHQSDIYIPPANVTTDKEKKPSNNIGIIIGIIIEILLLLLLVIVIIVHIIRHRPKKSKYDIQKANVAY